MCVYVCVCEREREHAHEQGEGQRENRTSCWAGSPMWGSVPGLRGRGLSRGRSLDRLGHPGAPYPDALMRLHPLPLGPFAS